MNGFNDSDSKPENKRRTVIPWPKKTQECRSELSRLLKHDSELADFYRYVHENGLRERAVEILSRRISQDENGF